MTNLILNIALTMSPTTFSIASGILALLTFSGCQGASLSPPGLTLLGSGQSVNAEGSLYFTSNNPTTWKNARSMCISLLGNNASLVSIETPNELMHIAMLLASGGNAMRSFWTEGRYEDQGREIFSWGKVDEMGQWIWAEAEPSRRTSGIRTAMRSMGNGQWSAFSLQETENHPFICELTPGSSAEPNPCFNTNDLIIALDSSGSVDESDFTLAKQFFVNNITTAWVGWEKTRLSFLTYSSAVSIIFALNNQYNEFELERKVLNAPYLGGGTASDLALQTTFRDFEMYKRNVTRNLVFLTDGHSNDPDKTREQAFNLHSVGVRVFSIGIGTGPNEVELRTIASHPSHVFNTESFAELKNLLKPITQIVCDN